MFQVLQIRKIKTIVGLKNVAAHNSRENIYTDDGELQEGIERPDWLNHEFSQDDFFDKQITNQPDQMSAEVLRKREKLIADLKRKPQKNASAGVEFVISASPEFQGDWNAFFGKAESFLRKKFGDNCIQFAVHHDETTPHMHVLYVPIVEKEGVRKYSSSEFLGGKFGMQKLHTEFYEQVGKYFGLERGEAGSRATHGNARDFQKKINELESRELAVKEKEQQQIFLQENLKKTQEEQKAKKMELDEREKTLSDERERLLERSKALSDKETRLNAMESDIDAKGKILNENVVAINDNVEKLNEAIPKKNFDVLLSLSQKVIAGLSVFSKNISDKLNKWLELSPFELRQRADKLERSDFKNWKEYEQENKRQKRCQQGWSR